MPTDKTSAIPSQPCPEHDQPPVLTVEMSAIPREILHENPPSLEPEIPQPESLQSEPPPLPPKRITRSTSGI